MSCTAIHQMRWMDGCSVRVYRHEGRREGGEGGERREGRRVGRREGRRKEGIEAEILVHAQDFSCTRRVRCSELHVCIIVPCLYFVYRVLFLNDLTSSSTFL